MTQFYHNQSGFKETAWTTDFHFFFLRNDGRSLVGVHKMVQDQMARHIRSRLVFSVTVYFGILPETDALESIYQHY